MAEVAPPTAGEKPGLFKRLFNRGPKPGDDPAGNMDDFLKQLQGANAGQAKDLFDKSNLTGDVNNADQNLFDQLGKTKDQDEIKKLLEEQKRKDAGANLQDPKKNDAQDGEGAKIISFYDRTNIKVQKGAEPTEKRQVLSSDVTSLKFTGDAGQPVEFKGINKVLNTPLEKGSSVSLVYYPDSHTVIEFISHNGQVDSVKIPEADASKQIFYPEDGSKPMSVAEMLGLKLNGYYNDATWRNNFEKKVFSRQELANIGPAVSKYTEESAKNGEEAEAVIPRDKSVVWEVDCAGIEYDANCKSFFEGQKGTSIVDALIKKKQTPFSVLLQGAKEVELAEVSVCDHNLSVCKDGVDYDFAKGRVLNQMDAEELAKGDKFQSINEKGEKESVSLDKTLTKRHALKVVYENDVKQADGSIQKQKVTSWVLFKNMTEDKFVMLAEQNGPKTLKIENLTQKNQHFLDTRNPLNLSKVWENKDVPIVESPGVSVGSIFDSNGGSQGIEQTELGGVDGATTGEPDSGGSKWYNPVSWFKAA